MTVDEKRVTPQRRKCDSCGGDGHDSPCNNLLVHTAFEEQLLVRLEAIHAEIKSAFIDGDPVGHRNAHQAWIDSKNAEAKFWTEIRLDVAKKGTWFMLLVLLGLVAVGLATKLGIGLLK